jgi:CBS domain-containing protein
MDTHGVAQLARNVPIIAPEDTVRRAAGLIRASGGSRVLVHDHGRITGTVSERAIAALLAGAESLDEALDAPVGRLLDPNVVLVNWGVSLREAAELFASSDVDLLPLIDGSGAYHGAVFRSDLVAHLTGNLRPPTVAGMATPLGVYLTTGSVSGGAGSLGLFLTGVSLALMMTVAAFAVEGVMKLFGMLTGIRMSVLLASVPLTSHPNVYDIPFYASIVLSVVFFFVLMRLSPLSGYHAAEHMTVHAMEAGETLTPENVRSMPRVHPRCGTNLLAAAGVFLIIASRISNEFGVMIALLVVIVGWRTVGGWLQYFVTTRNPSDRQLENGVAAGNELIRRFQERPNFQLTGLPRIWKLGFPQTLAGMITTVWLLKSVFHLPVY